MNVYIILGIAYLVYIIFTRYRATKANRPTIQKQSSEREAPKQNQEGLLERLKRMAEEMQEEARKAQEQASGQNNTPTNQSEYPTEWVVTETGTKVHDLEGRRIKEEYLQSREDNVGREATMKEEYNTNRLSAKSMESQAVEEYETATKQGDYRHSKRVAQSAPKKKVTSRTMDRRNNPHPLAKTLFGPGGAKRAMIIKEVFERPNY